MLPTERPLSPHRLVTPTQPARPQETTPPTRQTPAPVTVPVSNATVAHSAHAPAQTPPAVVQDQLGNAAMAKVAAQAVPAVPLLVMPIKTGDR
ncbi:hypothetical protein ACH4JS_05620 [Streptomyces sp. NPDC017638]|uniref:hypothetical protein n=1 Tax=Streptomyces sp. NPDC017638 TaxID=3365004 RepID=UPI0037AD50E5